MKNSNENTSNGFVSVPNKFVSVDGTIFDDKFKCSLHNYELLWGKLGSFPQRISEADGSHPLNYMGGFPDENIFLWFDLKTEKDLTSINEFLTSAYEKVFSEPVNDNHLVKKLGVVCFEYGKTHYDFFKFYYLEDSIEYLQDFLKDFGFVANIVTLESSK